MTITKTDLKEMDDNGHLPWKNENNRWCVTYLCTWVEGVCEAEFDTIFEALEFSKEIKK